MLILTFEKSWSTQTVCGHCSISGSYSDYSVCRCIVAGQAVSKFYVDYGDKSIFGPDRLLLLSDYWVISSAVL